MLQKKLNTYLTIPPSFQNALGVLPALFTPDQHQLHKRPNLQPITFQWLLFARTISRRHRRVLNAFNSLLKSVDSLTSALHAASGDQTSVNVVVVQ